MKYDALYDKLGYRFRDESLLDTALTHRSVGSRNYERLEFLGDSVLNFVISADLFQRCPDLREGDLSRMRAYLVKGERLHELARRLELGDYLMLGSGEMKSGGHHRASILADAVEGIFGAIYLDGGFEACRQVILELYRPLLEDLPGVETLKDPKTRLQEWLQSRRLPLPRYEVIQMSGRDHERQFEVACELEHLHKTVKGRGSSRRKAEQAAASQALEILEHAG